MSTRVLRYYNGDSYYVTNGVLNWAIDGAVQVGDTVYCLSNSTVKAGYTGLCMSEDKTLGIMLKKEN